LLGGLVRRMSATRYVIQKEWLVGCGRVQIAHVPDGVVRHVGREVVTRFADPREYLRMVAKEVGRPLIGRTAHKTVEILKTHPDRPLFERHGRAVLIGGRFMLFAKP